MSEAPSAPAPGDPTPEAARAEIAGLRVDKEFIGKYANGDQAARDRLETLHRAAYPEPAATPGKPLSPAAQARQELEARKADPEFVRKVEGGDFKARQELDDLHARAYADGGENGRPIDEPLPFAFKEGTDEAVVVEADRAVRGVVEALGAEPDAAVGIVHAVELAHQRRMTPDGVVPEMTAHEAANSRRFCRRGPTTTRFATARNARLARAR